MSARGNRTTSWNSDARFAATRWSVVLAAGGNHAATDTRRALEDLVRIYWFPLYAFVRRQGYASAQAEDLVQGFLACLLEKKYLAQVDQSKGRFRSFLLAALTHFASKERDKQKSRKRGGGRPVISWDALDAEARYALEPADHLTPERLFDRRWALAVLDQVLARLSCEYSDAGKLDLYRAIEGCLTGRGAESYAAIAAQLGMTEAAVKTAAHRIRRRYRDLLRDEIAQTVNSPEQVEAEINYLLNCL